MSTTKGERREWLARSREAINQLPLNELFELPGRPHVVYQIRSYANTGSSLAEAASQARSDMPFLFKAFETGQIGPKRMAKMHGGKPRVATIHEYLDWTITAQSSTEDDELDFGGFRVVVILPRYVSPWPYPGDPGNCEGKKAHPDLGGPLPPFPMLQTHGRPMCAATIRSGPGYLEVPFVATQEHKRGKGYCRCLLEAIEDIARALKLEKLMLCSTNDPIVKSTWHHLNFDFASEEEMEAWDIPHADLVYLQNTTQMHKVLPPAGQYRPIVIKHKDFKQRTYARLDAVVKRPRLHTAPPKKNPPKKPALGKAPAASAAAPTQSTDVPNSQPSKGPPPQQPSHQHAQQEAVQCSQAPSGLSQGKEDPGGASRDGEQGAGSAGGHAESSRGRGLVREEGGDSQLRSRSRSRSSQADGSWLASHRNGGGGDYDGEPVGPAEGVSGSAWSQQPGGTSSQQQTAFGPPGKGRPALLPPPPMPQQLQQQHGQQQQQEQPNAPLQHQAGVKAEPCSEGTDLQGQQGDGQQAQHAVAGPGVGIKSEGVKEEQLGQGPGTNHEHLGVQQHQMHGGDPVQPALAWGGCTGKEAAQEQNGSQGHESGLHTIGNQQGGGHSSGERASANGNSNHVSSVAVGLDSLHHSQQQQQQQQHGSLVAGGMGSLHHSQQQHSGLVAGVGSSHHSQQLLQQQQQQQHAHAIAKQLLASQGAGNGSQVAALVQQQQHLQLQQQQLHQLQLKQADSGAESMQS
ncbi:hypothetical protein DUNSADRAFT_12149 [Dunaliella salina]|uniref:Increased DNA methylation 1 C-terminal domain-containing protein n=1 Tax=Dunaliella salina TaxID=3046 RepID=A0ABQ7GBW8_DUNSA|nr:hypothetical protein DUNSADRAFT_12149 [Dunaliella salina]|eukprot:KAF5832100.1 hypothetical protein DUNSADRAFT_12149 [Dunaliella salina]